MDSLAFPYLFSGIHRILFAKMLETPCGQDIGNTWSHLEHLQCSSEDKATLAKKL